MTPPSHTSSHRPDLNTEKNQSKSISLENAFNATFHEKYSFKQFLELTVCENVSTHERDKHIVHAPSNILKFFLRFLNTYVFNFFEVAPNVHSYTKNRNTLTAVSLHRNNRYFYQTDISKFFEHVDKKIVSKTITERLGNAPITDLPEHHEKILEYVAYCGYLPIGFSSSPSISNAALFDFDTKVSLYCGERGITYTRYSDDLILSSTDRGSLDNCEEVVSSILQSEFNPNASLNKAKTRRPRKGAKIKILGINIYPSGQLGVDKKIKKNLETLLYFFINDKNRYNNFLATRFKNDPESASGYLNHINTIEPSFIDKLRKKYGNLVVDGFFHRSLLNQ